MAEDLRPLLEDRELEEPRLDEREPDAFEPDDLEPADPLAVGRFAVEPPEEDLLVEVRPLEFLPLEDARPVSRLEGPRPEEAPAVRPLDLAEELLPDVARAVDRCEREEVCFLEEGEREPDLDPDFEAEERLELLREPEDLVRAFSG